MAIFARYNKVVARYVGLLSSCTGRFFFQNFYGGSLDVLTWCLLRLQKKNDRLSRHTLLFPRV